MSVAKVTKSLFCNIKMWQCVCVCVMLSQCSVRQNHVREEPWETKEGFLLLLAKSHSTPLADKDKKKCMKNAWMKSPSHFLSLAHSLNHCWIKWKGDLRWECVREADALFIHCLKWLSGWTQCKTPLAQPHTHTHILTNTHAQTGVKRPLGSRSLEVRAIWCSEIADIWG